jgi:hypothetical protein
LTTLQNDPGSYGRIRGVNVVGDIYRDRGCKGVGKDCEETTMKRMIACEKCIKGELYGILTY